MIKQPNFICLCFLENGCQLIILHFKIRKTLAWPDSIYFRGVGLGSDWLPLVRSLAVLVRNSSDTRTLLESNECHHSLPSNVGSVRTWQECEYSYTSYFVIPLNSSQLSNNKCTPFSAGWICLDIGRLWEVPHSLSVLCMMQKKTARKKLPYKILKERKVQSHTRCCMFYSWFFLQTKQKRDYS